MGRPKGSKNNKEQYEKLLKLYLEKNVKKSSRRNERNKPNRF
jgi:hypothetical protein